MVRIHLQHNSSRRKIHCSYWSDIIFGREDVIWDTSSLKERQLAVRARYPSLSNYPTHFCFQRELPLEGNVHLKHSSSSFSLYWFWYTLRYAKVLCWSVLMRRLWEVFFVVILESTVSKVNTLSNTQVCKCFHYNTDFFSFSKPSMRPTAERTAASQPSGWPNTPPSGHRLLRVTTTQKYFTLGDGPVFCGSVNSGWTSNAMSFRPCSPHAPAFLTLLVVSANRELEHYRKPPGVFVYC